MKRMLLYTLAGTLVLLFAAVLLLEQYLERTLPGRLTQAIELVVVIEDINLNPLGLEVEVGRLVIGAPDAPAIDVRNLAVELKLDFKKLQIDEASADYLYLNQNRWGERKRRKRDNFLFLDPYIPEIASIREFSYEFADRVTRFEQVNGRREGDRLILAGRSMNLDINLAVNSVEQALGFQQLRFKADLSNSFVSPVQVEVSIVPDEPGYALEGTVLMTDSAARFEAWSVQSWALPVESNFEISHLSPEAVTQWIGSLDGIEASPEFTDLLKQPLPSLVFPTHSSQLSVDEFTFGERTLGESRIELVLSPQGVVVPGYWFRFLGADVKGAAELLQQQESWKVQAKTEFALSQDDKDENPSLWEIQSGNLTLGTQGKTPGDLIDHATGDVHLRGLHERYPDREAVLESAISSDDDQFILEKLRFSFGDALVTGTASLPGERQQLLALNLSASNLDMDLFLSDSDSSQQGISIDLEMAEGIVLDWIMAGENITIAGIELAEVNLELNRTPAKGKIDLHLKSAENEKGEASLNWQSLPGAKKAVNGTLRFSDVLLGEPFVAMDMRSSGSVELKGLGDSQATLMQALELNSEVTFEFRNDGDWERAAVPDELLNLSGSGALIVEEKVIKGVDLDVLELAGAIQQVTGSVYVEPGGDPWLRVDATAQQLDLDWLLRLVPVTERGGSSKDFLLDAREFHLHMEAAQLVFREHQFSDVLLDWRMIDNGISQKLVFTHPDGGVRSESRLEVIDDQLSATVKAEVLDLYVEDYLKPIEFNDRVPLSGDISIHGAGGTMAELVSQLTGTVSLNGDATAEIGKKREIDLSLRRSPTGVNLSIDSLIVGQNSISGEAAISGEDGVAIDLTLTGGHLVLSELLSADTSSSASQSALERTAQAGGELVEKVKNSSSRLLGQEESQEPEVQERRDDRIFSATPFAFTGLSTLDVSVEGRLDSLITPWAKTNSVNLGVSLEEGVIDARLQSDDINGGRGHVKFFFDTSVDLPSASIEATLIGIGNYPADETADKSVFLDFRSSGASFAELAGGLEGAFYVEFGRGLLDYEGISFLTSDITTTMVTTLIPGAERETPKMRCGVTWGEFHDGIGSTPFGFAAQTKKANLLGEIGMNLKTEELVVEFDSKSRKLRGLSVGDVFSKTVGIEGTLRKPKVVAKKGSLAWRSWAAISTGGLSAIGEGVVGQVLSSDDPCGEVKKNLQENRCVNEPVQSTLVCPG